MARDRKRSKQRRATRVPEDGSASTHNGPMRSDLPGSLDHAGEVDEFDAALVRGAHGVPASEPASSDEPREGGAVVTTGGAGAGPRGAALAPEGPTGEAVARERRARQSFGARAVAFLRASWAELQRVQWPDRQQVAQATAVVLGFVVVAGVYLGVADWAAQKIVNLIL